jgi:hypothetical protein
VRRSHLPERKVMTEIHPWRIEKPLVTVGCIPATLAILPP